MTAIPAHDGAPRVSVVMAINRIDAYLKLALDSILNQSFADFELLIVVDARSRELHGTIFDLCMGDQRVKILESPSLGGLALALNLGIAASRADLIARMDGDDISLPERFVQQVRYLDEHPEVAVVGCRVELIDENGNAVTRRYPFYESNREIRKILPFRTPMPHPALMLRKGVLLAVGGYKYAHSAEDWELFIRIARDDRWQFHNLDRVLFQYRRHPLQGTRPELIRAVFLDTASFLFSEFLRTLSWRYLAGICLKHPWLLKTRNSIRQLLGDKTN